MNPDDPHMKDFERIIVELTKIRRVLEGAHIYKVDTKKKRRKLFSFLRGETRDGE